VTRRSYTILGSPIGELLLVGAGGAIHGLSMLGGRPPQIDPAWEPAEEPFAEAAAQLGEYFAGRRRDFDLALAMGGTPFQRRVWEELRAIPYGDTISYGELARRIGRPSAVRAVGGANRRNPIAVIVPCHRVIGADGTLTGFGGGIDRKRALLDLEAGVLALSAVSR
jgi:methylated-DNA-[protein]-cysteine S-methyltransferase